MFKIKRIKPLEDLLFESELIKFGDQFIGINQDYQNSGGQNTNDTNSNKDIWNRLDYLFDQFLDKGIVDLEKDLAQPIYEREFGSEYGKRLSSAYLKYCKDEITRISTQINKELMNDYIDTEKLKSLGINRIQIAARIEILEKIYLAFKSINDAGIVNRATEILNEISNIKSEMSEQYMSSIKTVGQTISKPISIINDFDATDIDKEQNATTILFNINGLTTLLPFYPEETRNGVNQAKNRIENIIEDQIGHEKTEAIRQSILANGEELVVLKRIINLKYMHFSKEDEIYQEIDRIKIAINKLHASHKGTIASKPVVIEYLNKLLAEEADSLLKRARDKNISIKEINGIHYDFNSRLILHQVIDLPVTGKQMADASWLMKFRKRMAAILSLIPVGSKEMTAAGQAWANFGRQTHNLYAKVLNTSGKFIGKMIGGRSGELKGDAITRLLIPTTSVLDKEPNTVNIPNRLPITEEGGAMGPDGGSTPGGSGYQLPGQLGTAGPIKPATDSTIGSGDKFSESWKDAKKRRKKKKNNNINENAMSLMNFATFIAK